MHRLISKSCFFFYFAEIYQIIYSGFGTKLIFKIIEKTIGIRATEKEEAIGLDETQHGETAYTNFD